jgi:hypothetical protein
VNDTAYIGAIIDELDGPVVLVVHSYWGSVIIVADASDKMAVLVYVAMHRARRRRIGELGRAAGRA